MIAPRKTSKIYLAARFPKQKEMRDVGDYLKTLGYDITARWVYGGEDNLTRQEIAVLDIEDVEKADTVISFTEPYGTPVPGGGRHVEFGYGLALGKRMILIGSLENVFHHYPNVERYISIDEWLLSDGNKALRVT